MVASINKGKSGSIPASPMGGNNQSPSSPPTLVDDKSWDAEQGVWVGSRALSTAESEEVPDPLVIFGYASLMFRPQESFAHVKRFGGWVPGWKRVWAQRSTDHRGTPDKPGLVCTVTPDAVLEAKGKRTAGDPPSWVYGVAYEIPKEIRDEVLDELDFREKGGYTRTVVDIYTSPDGLGEKEVPIKGLLYAGSDDNPNFYLPSSVEEAAHIIAWSHGPSGENKEYLFRVADFLREADAACEDTQVLSCAVQRVLAGGLDLRHRLDHRFTRLPPRRRLGLHAWGSNSHGQLGRRAAAGEEEEDVRAPAACHVDLDLWGPWPGLKQLCTGDGHSAVLLSNGRLYMWGWAAEGQIGMYAEETEGPGEPFLRPFPRRASAVAMGHAHTLILEEGGKVYGLGANKYGQASGVASEAACEEEGGGHVRMTDRAVGVAAGVRHSAAVTARGEVVTWGCEKDGACLQSGRPWAPRDGAKAVKVCCGWRHTVILDDRGRVWTLGGSNKHGQLGRGVEEGEGAGVPQLVASSEGKVVVDIACGWSHTVVVVEDGQRREAWGWGRNDRGQLGLGEGSEEFVHVPRALSLPVGTEPQSLHCSSESTVLLASDGSVWSTGWNEHGNLGLGDKTDRHVWERVQLSAVSFIAAGGAHVLAVEHALGEPLLLPK